MLLQWHWQKPSSIPWIRFWLSTRAFKESARNINLFHSNVLFYKRHKLYNLIKRDTHIYTCVPEQIRHNPTNFLRNIIN